MAKAELYEELTGILEAVFEPENVQQEPEQPQEIPVPELSLSIQMEEGASYTMGYGFLFPSWKNGFLTVDYLLTERRIYPPAGTLVFDKAKVEALLGALDVEEKNFSHGLQVKEELYSWGVDFLDSELTGNCFEISKLNNEGYEEENILLITDQGDIYVKGYYYTGEKEAFKSAFAEFMEGCAAEAGSMEESWQKKLLEAVQSITWREVAE